MPSDNVWNDLKLQKTFCKNNVSKLNAFWQYLKRFRTAEEILKTMSFKHALWRYLKWFRTAEKILKTMSLKHAFWRLTVVETIWNFRQMKTMSLKHALWRDVKRFGTAEQKKTRTVNCAFWRYFKLLCQDLTAIGLYF